MGGASSYIAILAIAAFLTATWLATKVSKAVGVSSIVLEITTGVVLGPGVVGLISEQYAECEHKRHTKCQAYEGEDDATIWKAFKDESMSPKLREFAGGDYCSHWAHLLEHDTTLAAGHGDKGHGDKDKDGGKDEDVPAEDTPVPADVSGGAEGDEVPAKPPATGQDDDANVKQPSIQEGQNDDNDEAAAAAVVDSSHAAGGRSHSGGRRLSGSGSGGEEYDSLGQCLSRTCEAEIGHHCGETPGIFTLIGHAGVALMIFESGMHFDFDKAKIVGPKACCVAVLGTVLPLITGMVLMVAYGYPATPDGISVGTALAPTSVGIALRLLGEAGVLQHDFGQAIITAAFVDDILSLILFNVLFSLRGDFDVLATVVFPIIGIIFMGVAMVLAVKFWPWAIRDKLLPRLPKKKGDPKVTGEDEALFAVMMGLLILYGTITHFLGTHLWGCFIAGMSFACLDTPGNKGHTHHVWTRQTKRVTSWMIRIFFSCTVAFSIPIAKLLSFEAFWKGSIMGIIPCIATKVLCAPFMGNARWVIGWAMVGRAEFAYLIAQMASAAGMIDESAFSITIWALLYATVFAPLVFTKVLARYMASEGIVATDSEKVVDSDFEDDDAVEASRSQKPQARGVKDAGITFAPFALPEQDLKASKQLDFPEAVKPTQADLDDNKDGSFGAREPQQQSRKFWWGRANPPSVAESPNGFLCCLFFKKVLVSE